MMQSALQDVARLQPTPDSLNIILKSTHFKDDILAIDSKIQFRIDYSTNIPVLIFKFTEPYYDFLQILGDAQTAGSNQGWLNKNPAIVNLILSHSVIADELSIRSFSLNIDETEKLRTVLHARKELPISQTRALEEYVYANSNLFLA